MRPLKNAHLTSLKSVAPERARLLVLAALHFFERALGQIVDHPVHCHASFAHGVDDDGDSLDDVHAGLDVEFRHAVALGRLLQLLQLRGVLLAERAHRLQPDVQHVKLAVGEGGGDTAARRVAAHDNVFDLEVEDGELDDAEEGEIGRVHDVGDVAVGEDIAGLEAEDGGFGDARVGTAEPEDGGGLAFGGGREEVGVSGIEIGGPFCVAGQAGAEVVGRLLVWCERQVSGDANAIVIGDARRTLASGEQAGTVTIRARTAVITGRIVAVFIMHHNWGSTRLSGFAVRIGLIKWSRTDSGSSQLLAIVIVRRANLSVPERRVNYGGTLCRVLPEDQDERNRVFGGAYLFYRCTVALYVPKLLPRIAAHAQDIDVHVACCSLFADVDERTVYSS
nr:hypothetical protein CFP56_00368 [Quercus suber]